MAEVQFMVCPSLEKDPADNYYGIQQCEHNILFLKGLCESSNNQQNYCFSADMQAYLNDHNINNAPRPPDTYCNMYPDKCILMLEDQKKDAIELFEESGQKLIDTYDRMIEDLQSEQQGQQQSQQQGSSNGADNDGDNSGGDDDNDDN